MKKLIIYLFNPILKRYYNLNNRTQELEIIVNTFLLDVEWKDEPQKYLNGQKKTSRNFY